MVAMKLTDKYRTIIAEHAVIMFCYFYRKIFSQSYWRTGLYKVMQDKNEKDHSCLCYCKLALLHFAIMFFFHSLTCTGLFYSCS